MSDVKVSWMELDTAATPVDVRVSWLELDTAATPVDVKVSWVAFDTAAAPCDVRVSWIAFDSSAETSPIPSEPSNEVILKPWYIKRKKKILLFNSAQEADAFLEAEELAEKAIQAAQKTSRRARKRLRDKLITIEPIQTVDVDLLTQAVERFSIPVDLPYLLAQQDFDRVMQIMAMAMEMQDEEDIELLLLA